MSSPPPARPAPAARPARDSRSRILDAAWRLIASRRRATVTLAEIGRAAGVSRQAVHLHFGNRAGLLVAMVRHRDQASPIVRAFAVIAVQEDARRALEAYLRNWCRYIPEILPVARALQAAAITDPSAREAWEDRMDRLRRGLRRMIARLHDEGLLESGWRVREAAEWCWSEIHLDNWQHMVAESGWSPTRYTDRLVRTVFAVLVRTGADA